MRENNKKMNEYRPEARRQMNARRPKIQTSRVVIDGKTKQQRRPSVKRDTLKEARKFLLLD